MHDNCKEDAMEPIPSQHSELVWDPHSVIGGSGA